MSKYHKKQKEQTATDNADTTGWDERSFDEACDNKRDRGRGSKAESVRRRRLAWELFGAGKSQKEIAKELGVSQPSVSKYLRGDSNPDYAKLLATKDAEARAAGRATIDDEDAEWERGKAKRERSLEIIEAEIERLALLPDLECQVELKPAAKRLDIPLTALRNMVKAKRPKKAAKKSAAPEFDLDELQRTAGHIIECPDILDLFAKDFGNVIAGEAINGKLLYLVATSRLFDKTMSAAIKGTSAAGKSEIRKRVLDFFPPEDVVSFTSLSEKALIYYEGDFNHKILSMGEAVETDQQNFQNYLLRELISEGCLRHNTVQKVGNEIVAITIVKHGPVTFLVTTTKNKLHPENETRMLSIEMDDSENQTRRVLDKVAQVVGTGDFTPVDYTPWQDFQRWLAAGERRVVVPFAAAISDLIPKVAVRLRRDFTQVLCAIMAHALLHRDQRERDEAGRIVADIDHDYANARELMNAILAEGSGVAVSKATTETIEAVKQATAGMTEAAGASAQEIGRILKLDKSAARRRLLAACRDDYVVNLEQRRGMPGKYRASGQKVEPVNILPTATDLAEQFNRVCLHPKPVPPCHRDGIAEASQSDNGGMDGGNRLATGLATDKSLNSNGESPPVAGWQGFSGGIDTHENNSAASEHFSPVCQHCGLPEAPGNPVQLCAVEGEEFLLHSHCQDEWQEKDEERHG